MKEAIKNRRTYYSIANSSPISDDEIKEIIDFSVENVPSAFNSQSTRIVLLISKEHKKLWEIALNNLRKIVPAEAFASTEAKINSFIAGYGTILYFEEEETVKTLQTNFPLYAHNFPVWSEQTSAMHQFAIWTMLEERGLGASLQHYNEVIEEEIKKHWSFKKSWKLIAQMPFGTPTAEAGEKSFLPLEERVIVLK